MYESLLREFQDKIAIAKENKDFALVSFLEDSIEHMWNLNMISKCPSCDKFQADQGECAACKRDARVVDSDREQFLTRHL